MKRKNSIMNFSVFFIPLQNKNDLFWKIKRIYWQIIKTLHVKVSGI